MKKALKILFNIFLCIVHGLCVLVIQAFLAVTVIWFFDDYAPIGFSWNIRILAGVALYLALRYVVLGQLFKRSLICMYTLPALRWIDYVVCVSFTLLWIGLAFLCESMVPPFLWQALFIIGVNAAIMLARKYISPAAIEVSVKQQ